MNKGNIWVFAEEIMTVTNNYISHLLCEICDVSGAEFYNKLWRQPWIIFFTPENFKKPATLLCQTIIDFISTSGVTEEQNTPQKQKRAIVWEISDRIIEPPLSDIAREDDLPFRQKLYAKNILKLGKQLINTLRFTDILIKCSLDDWKYNCLLSWVKDTKMNLQH